LPLHQLRAISAQAIAIAARGDTIITLGCTYFFVWSL
jgi:hypothetical protein